MDQDDKARSAEAARVRWDQRYLVDDGSSGVDCLDSGAEKLGPRGQKTEEATGLSKRWTTEQEGAQARGDWREDCDGAAGAGGTTGFTTVHEGGEKIERKDRITSGWQAPWSGGGSTSSREGRASWTPGASANQ